MLELKNIVKDYVSGNNVTHALKGISVNFRKNEFVSILGASGCGKTTTLNIIGGLDRYTSGDLIIDGTSTKNYTDRDWDTYRNHSIGFIFQTYNLIGHQNILRNVELALTISGVGKAERKARAIEALKKVGLEGLEKKKPNQLSGGQCQRVAIARALINNPEILLADEPTGALDSETSVQIMDLLKEVASDRLVIMVTHNPELAEKYSTRIIRMSDGLLTDDSMPFDGVEETVAEEADEENPIEEFNKGKKKKSSMSLATATGLSLSNLRSKLRRTVLVTIAGSIGIIGVSAVLAVSRGVKDFIGEMQNDMLSAYPVQIAEQSVDMTSLMSGLNANDAKEHFVWDPEDPKVGVDSMINYLMTAYSDITKVKTNTIDKKLVSYIDSLPRESTAVINKNYAIDPTNNIFGAWVDDSMQTDEEKQAGNREHVVTRNMSFNGLTQRYIAELKTVEEFAAYASYVDLFTDFMKEMPDEKEYITSQYDIIAGDTLSLGKDDLVLVVDKNTTLTDLVLAQTGVFDHDEFLNIAKCAIDENEYKKSDAYNTDSIEVRKEKLENIRKAHPYRKEFKYEDLLNREFTYLPEDTIYEYKEEIATSEKTFSVAFAIVSGGDIERFIYLTSQKLGNMNILYGVTMYKEASEWKSDQVAAIPLNADASKTDESCLYGTWFALSANDLAKVAGMSTEEQTAYVMSHLKFALNLNSKASGMSMYYPNMAAYPMGGTPISPDYSMQETPIRGYACKAEAEEDWISNPQAHKGSKMKISAILRLKSDKRFGCLDRGLYYTNAFVDAYSSDAKEAKVTTAMKEQLRNPASRDVEFKAYTTFDYFSDKTKTMIPNGYASSLNGDLSSSFSDLFSGLTGVNHQETNALHLRSLSGLKSVSTAVEGGGTEISFEKLPKTISIYPKSFADKDVITKHLDKWNEDGNITVKVDGVDVTLAKNQRDELSYTDTIQIIVKVITTLIDAITIALVVFTSLSLVVSCFMIAVITYISVVERIKEIGVIRSLGGRKRDVASLFVMENLLTGLFSGVFGVAFTYLIQIVLNIALKAAFGVVIANFTIGTAAIMVGVSVLLSVLSGAIPSQSAAHKDPVVALRTAE